MPCSASRNRRSLTNAMIASNSATETNVKTMYSKQYSFLMGFRSEKQNAPHSCEMRGVLTDDVFEFGIDGERR